MTQCTRIYCLILLSDYSSKLVSWKLPKLVHTFNCVWFTTVQALSMLLAHSLRITPVQDGCSVNIRFNATVPEFNIRATASVALHPLRATLLYFSSAFLRRWNIGQEIPSRLFPSASPRARRPQASPGRSPKVQGLPRWLSGKESACQSGDLSLIPGLGSTPGEGIGYPLQYLPGESP